MKLDDLPAHVMPRASAEPPSAAPNAGVLLELQALALRHGPADEAALAVVSDVALRLGALRVSLAWRDMRRAGVPARVGTLSHGGDADQRRQLVRRLAAAADEALDHGREVEWPTTTDPARVSPAPAALAHAALAAEGGAPGILSVPFDTASSTPGVWIFELPGELDAAGRALALDAALFTGPLLRIKRQLDAPWLTRLRALFLPGAGHDGRTAWSQARMAIVAAAIGVASAALWPTTHHVVAPTRVEGLGQRSITAPSDGYLQSVAVRPGERVKAGQLLATLDDREPQLEVERTGAERSQVERQYGDALARDDAGAIIAARAKLEQLTAQHELAQRRLQRARLLAPFDGVLIGGDLAASVGMPVRRGQELMVVAPASGWRLVAEIAEHDIAHVQVGQQSQVLFAALSGKTTDFTVVRIAPVAVQVEGRNVFEAEGRLDQAVSGLHPGLRGVARIDAGERSPASVWWERGSNWLRRMWWTFLS